MKSTRDLLNDAHEELGAVRGKQEILDELRREGSITRDVYIYKLQNLYNSTSVAGKLQKADKQKEVA